MAIPHAVLLLILGGVLGWGLKWAGERDVWGESSQSFADSGASTFSSQNRADPFEKAKLRSRLGSVIAELERLTAAQCEARIKDGSLSQTEMQAVFVRWLELEDPETVLEKLPKISHGAKKAFFDAWVLVDFNGVFSEDLFKRQFAELRFVKALPFPEIDLARYVKSGGRPMPFDRSFEKEWSEFCCIDPFMAAQRFLEIQTILSESEKANGSYRSDPTRSLLEVLIKAWAANDPRAAWRWLGQLDIEESLKSLVQERLLGFWKYHDPKAHEAFVKNELKDNAVSEKFGHRFDLSALMSNEIDISLDDIRRATLDEMSEKEAAEFLNSERALFPGYSFIFGAKGHLSHLESLEAWPESPRRKAILESIIDDWLVNDPRKARDYLESKGLTEFKNKLDYEMKAHEGRAALERLKRGEVTVIQWRDLLNHAAQDAQQRRMFQGVMNQWIVDDPFVAGEALFAAFPENQTNEESSAASWVMSRAADNDLLKLPSVVSDLPSEQGEKLLYEAIIDVRSSDNYFPNELWHMISPELSGERRLRAINSHYQLTREYAGAFMADRLLESSGLSPQQIEETKLEAK
mgnify:CR=1 FL=1